MANRIRRLWPWSGEADSASRTLRTVTISEQREHEVYQQIQKGPAETTQINTKIDLVVIVVSEKRGGPEPPDDDRPTKGWQKIAVLFAALAIVVSIIGIVLACLR